MADHSTRMQWPYPSREEDPWFNAFKSFVDGVDASGYAYREDRHAMIAGGGDVSWNATTGVLEWTDIIRILAAVTGYQWQVPAGSVTLDATNGVILYVSLNRGPGSNTALTAQTGNTVPDDDNAFALAMRVGSTVYWRSGVSLEDGSTIAGVAPEPGGGGGLELDWVDTYQYTQVAVPVEETVCYGFFDGSLVSGTAYFWAIMTPTLSAVGAAELRLYDVGPKAGPPEPAVLVATLSSATSGGPQYLEQALAVGAVPAANQIQDTPRMYEVRAYENSVPGDTIYVGCGGMADRG